MICLLMIVVHDCLLIVCFVIYCLSVCVCVCVFMPFSTLSLSFLSFTASKSSFHFFCGPNFPLPPLSISPFFNPFFFHFFFSFLSQLDGSLDLACSSLFSLAQHGLISKPSTLGTYKTKAFCKQKLLSRRHRDGDGLRGVGHDLLLNASGIELHTVAR